MPTQSRGHGTRDTAWSGAGKRVEMLPHLAELCPRLCVGMGAALWHTRVQPCPRKAVGMAPDTRLEVGMESRDATHDVPNHAHAKPWAWHPIHGLDWGRKESRDANHWQNPAHAKPWAWHPIHGLEWGRKESRDANHWQNPAHAKPWAGHPMHCFTWAWEHRNSTPE